MLLGVVSDSHGRNLMVSLALAELRQRGVQTVLHCGDVGDESTIALFRNFTAHFVFGNCDYDRDELREAIASIGATLHEDWGQLELEGVKIAFLHGDDERLKKDVENSGHFDFLFYGHTHIPREHRTGPTRVINPGALHRARPKTFLIVDLPGGAVEQVSLDEAIT